MQLYMTQVCHLRTGQSFGMQAHSDKWCKAEQPSFVQATRLQLLGCCAAKHGKRANAKCDALLAPATHELLDGGPLDKAYRACKGTKGSFGVDGDGTAECKNLETLSMKAMKIHSKVAARLYRFKPAAPAASNPDLTTTARAFLGITQSVKLVDLASFLKDRRGTTTPGR